MTRAAAGWTPNAYELRGAFWDVWLWATATYEIRFFKDPRAGIVEPRFHDDAGELTALGLTPTGWLAGELMSNGWDMLLGVYEFCRADNPTEEWLLREGLSREQPFKARVLRPRGYRSRDGEWEYDAEYYPPVILERAERASEFAARRWGKDYEMWLDANAGLWVPKAASWPFDPPGGINRP